MKTKIFFALVLVIFCSTLSIAQTTIKKGDEARVPSWEWVDVMNQEAVARNGSSPLGYGETCGIEMGGTVTVVGIDTDRGVLVRYTAPGNPIGTPCPSGTLFFITQEVFSEMTGEYNRQLSDIEEQKESVKKLLEQQ
ncbi:MAG: hypothetical protein WAV31_05370 [Candidatus Moraniibacteriota bacterium]